MATKTFNSTQFPGLPDTYKIPPQSTEYNSAITYSIDDYCVYEGQIYRCIQEATGKTPDSETSYWTATTLSEDINYFKNKTQSQIAEVFNPTKNYAIGAYAEYNNDLYKFIVQHDAGPWNSEHVIKVTLSQELGGASNVVSRGVITLSTTWVGDSSPYSQIVIIPDIAITAQSKVDLQLTTAQLISLQQDYVEGLLVENNNSVLTVYCFGNVPSEEMRVQCTIQDTDSSSLAQAYVKFESSEPGVEFTLSTRNSTKNWDGTLYFSTDTITWTVWNGMISISSNGGVLCLRGLENTKITGSSNDYRYGWLFTSTAKINCTGNIENLLDWQKVKAGIHPVMADYCYSYLFFINNYENDYLLTPPELGATLLSNKCYYSMFERCSSLITPPALPATELAPYCYSRMFWNCTDLSAAPALPATDLEDYCYQGMFYGCRSLVVAPVLSALTLTTSCYDSMFQQCEALLEAPELPSTSLADSCYKNMFFGCTSLSIAPVLLATTLAPYCYYSMFRDCTSLTVAPNLPATTMTECCYQTMFRGCSSLITPPALPATTLYTQCYASMFMQCYALTTLPQLPAETLTTACYSSMFSDCSHIKLSTTQTGEYNYQYMIPMNGSGSLATSSVRDMFKNTGGTFTGTPQINIVYYTDHEPVFPFS